MFSVCATARNAKAAAIEMAAATAVEAVMNIGYRSVLYAIGVAQVAVVTHSQQCLLTSIRLIEVRLFMGASQPSGCMS